MSMNGEGILIPDRSVLLLIYMKKEGKIAKSEVLELHGPDKSGCCVFKYCT